MQASEHSASSPPLRIVEVEHFIHAWRHSPIVEFVESSDPSQVVVLRDDDYSAGAFRTHGSGIWQQMLSLRAGGSLDAWICTAAAMRDWMFDQAGALSIWSIADPDNPTATALAHALGARSLAQFEGAEIFEISRRVH